MPCININNFRKHAASLDAYLLLDVRTPQEYREGHLPGSLNLPLQRIEEAEEMIEDWNMPVFLYCRSGARSARAAAQLEELGYSNVQNLGGIAAYSGRLEV